MARSIGTLEQLMEMLGRLWADEHALALALHSTSATSATTTTATADVPTAAAAAAASTSTSASTVKRVFTVDTTSSALAATRGGKVVVL